MYDNPTGFTLLLSISGTLTFDGQCLRVVDRTGTYDLVWPAGTSWDGDRQSVILNGVEAKLGDTVTLVGGPTSGQGSEEIGGILNPPPPECISGRQWLVSQIRSVEPAIEP